MMFSFCCPDCYNNYKFGEQCDEEQCFFCFGILEMSLIFSLPSCIIASIFNQIVFWKKPLTMPFNLICKGKLTRRYCLYLLWCAWGKAYYWGRVDFSSMESVGISKMVYHLVLNVVTKSLPADKFLFSVIQFSALSKNTDSDLPWSVMSNIIL